MANIGALLEATERERDEWKQRAETAERLLDAKRRRAVICEYCGKAWQYIEGVDDREAIALEAFQHFESCEKNPHIAARKQAERQRDELLDVILAQAQRSLISIPHDIWAAAVRISKQVCCQPGISTGTPEQPEAESPMTR